MLNKKRKGFTIVELVIVIAVIAILAAVMIPTFAGIIDKANESADKQAVRQMNIALAAEAIENEPADVEDVIDILANAGFNSTDKLVPVSAGHGFYWCKAANMIMLIRDEGENSPELIFPTEEAAVNTAFDAAKTNWTAATTGDDAAFVDLEPAGEAAGLPTGGTGGTGGGTGGTGGAGNGDGTVSDPYTVSTEAQLKDALSKGGYIKLTNNIDLTNTDGAVSISEDVNIDLAGYKLEISDVNEIAMDENGDFVNNLGSDIVSVSGKLTITDTGNTGSLVIAEPNEFDGQYTLDDYYVGYWHYFCGIRVAESGTLTLENINVSGNRHYNIVNAGSVEFNNVVYDVNGGASSTYNTWEVYGLYNEGSAEITGATFTVNSGTGLDTTGADTTDPVTGEPVASVTISNSTFVANGTEGCSIYAGDGTVNVTETRFSEGTDFGGYGWYDAPIVSQYSGTQVNLTSVTVEVRASEDPEVEVYSVYATTGGKVTINSGTFEQKLLCVSDAGEGTAITIKGGTICGIAYENLTAESQIFEGYKISLTEGTNCWVISESQS